jgi:hypothetical protein
LVAANDNAIGGTSLAPNFTICGLTPGTTYYLQHDGSGTVGNYSISISPINLEAGTFVDVLKVCTGDSVNLFTGITGNQPNGVWTAQLASVATGLTGSQFHSAGLAYQTFNFQYRLEDGCAYDSIIAKVKIYPPSSAGTDGTINVCKNQPVNLLSGLSGTINSGGKWYNPSNAVIASPQISASKIPGSFNYKYIVGNTVCRDDTATILLVVSATCDYLSLEEMYFGSMTLYPNPSNDIVYISNAGSSYVFNYTVTDIEGRVVAKEDKAINGTSKTTISLAGKSTGVYLIRVFNESAEKVFRVVLQ